MSYIIPPRLDAFGDEADAIAPNRRRTSDGDLGDAAHTTGDHRPDPVTEIVHAKDLSQSMPGTPYWKPGYGQFDAFAYARRIVAAYQSATPAERFRRWPWLQPPSGGYMVWFEAGLGYEVIFNPSHPSGPVVRPNGYPKIGHTEHLHLSIAHTRVSENDRQSVFGGVAEEDEVTPEQMTELENRIVNRLAVFDHDTDQASGVVATIVKNYFEHYTPEIVGKVCDELVSKPYDVRKLGRVELAMKQRLKSIYLKLGIPVD